MNAITDQDVAAVEKNMLDYLRGLLQHFHIAVRGDGIVLNGHASSYHARQVAEDRVAEWTGLPVIRNEIEVA